MTDLPNLAQILTVCEAQYAKSQQDFAQLRAKEDKLRHELSRLAEMGLSAGEAPQDQTQMRAIGADIIWQGWLGRAKSALNVSLAQVLAAKEAHLTEVRKAYGKVQVIQDLMAQENNKKQARKSQALLAKAIEMSVIMARQDQ